MGSDRDALRARAAAYHKQCFGVAAEAGAVAPGRINIIGEHTDYAGGLCLPAAVDRYLAVAVSRADTYQLTSEAAGSQPVQVAAGDIKPTGTWADHPLGVLHEMSAEKPIEPVRVAVVSEIPAGAGLSSSAALGVATGLAVAALAGRALDAFALARLCRRAENRFLGVPSGLMDQVACLLGRAGSALLFNAEAEIAELVALPPEAAWLVCETGTRRSLRGGQYADRPAEAGQALDLARERHLGLRSLVDLDPIEVETLGLPPPLDRRARHIVGECQRVRLAIACLEAGNLAALGQLMLTSHRSLARDCEVSTPELDQLVEVAVEAGCAGARLMGAGFGGSVIALVGAGAAPGVAERIRKRYRPPTGGPGTVHQVGVVDGAMP